MRRPEDPRWYTSRVEVALYLLAAVTYIGFGMFHKFLLNWIIGGIFSLTAIIQVWKMTHNKGIEHRLEHPEEETMHMEDKIEEFAREHPHKPKDEREE